MALNDSTVTAEKTRNPGDEYPSTRPGLKTTIALALLLVGGALVYYWGQQLGSSSGFSSLIATAA